MLKRIRKIFEQIQVSDVFIWILISFFVWCYAFRRFILSELVLASDAYAYYEHFKFFLDHLRHGIFPLWDPTRDGGSPNTFFLCRIGPYNPFYFLILFFDVFLPYTLAYLSFVSVYYFLGSLGFFLIAEKIFKDRRIAFITYLLLLFSALGTRIFDSYILLSFVPMVWFFYFLICLIENPQRKYFIGLTFCLMIIATTYIPFYFFLIFFSFLFSYLCFYAGSVKGILIRLQDFITKERLVVVLCATALIVSLYPSISFFKETHSGEIALPARHYESETKNPLSVTIKAVTGWGVVEDLVFSYFFLSDLKRFQFAVLYVPLFAYIVFLLGFILPITRRLAFFFLWSVGFLIFLMPNASPVYIFLYKHIFFFKYFRNLHFFLWLILLPLLILFAGEQTRGLLGILKDGRKQGLKFILITLAHIAISFLIYFEGNPIVTSFVVVILSWIFFTLHIFRPEFIQKRFFLFTLILICIQPLEVYRFLNLNSDRYRATYRYDIPYDQFAFNDKSQFGKDYWLKNIDLEKEAEPEPIIPGEDIKPPKPKTYFSTYWNNYILDHFNNDIYWYYMGNKFLIYDQIEWVDLQNLDVVKIQDAWRSNRNLAFVPKKDHYQIPAGVKFQGDKVKIATEHSDWIEILRYDVNSIKFKIILDSPKFLVYNDCLHSKWYAFIDGQETEIWQANIGYKGLWIPAGEHVVYFRFGSIFDYFLSYYLMFQFLGIFLYLLWLIWSSEKDIVFIRREV